LPRGPARAPRWSTPQWDADAHTEALDREEQWRRRVLTPMRDALA
jgi:hypothetical protein